MKRSLLISFIILLLSVGCHLNAQSKKNTKKTTQAVSLDSLIFQKLTNRLEVGFTNPDQYGSNFSNTYFNGLKVGLTTEYPLKNNFSLLTGVFYNLVYSDKLQKKYNSMVINTLTYAHYLNVPLQAIYNLPVSNDLKFFGYGGPTLQVGLSQIQSVYSTYTPIVNSHTDLYKSNLSQLDLQLGLGLGVQFKNFQLKGGYDFGVLNINKLTTGSLYQKGWYISLAVKL